jgi:hypothetical protein
MVVKSTVSDDHRVATGHELQRHPIVVARLAARAG